MNKTRMYTLLMASIKMLLFATFYTQSERIGQASTTAQPTVSSVTGSTWSFHCPSSFNGYLEVPYSGRSDSGVTPITINGTNLNLVTGVSLSAPGYTASISGKTSSRIVLDVRAGSAAENPRPVSAPTLTLSFPGGSVRHQMSGLIPALYHDSLDWGQCTWWAAGIARLQSGRSVIRSYSQGAAISPTPTSSAFPKTGSVLMTYEKHMSYLTDIRETGRIANKDGSVRITYQLAGTQYNAACDSRPSSFNTTMVTSLSRAGTYTFVSKPKVVYEVDRVAQ